MKRLLIILLLLVVPLQTGLASVCSYCPHSASTDADPHALVHGAAKLQQALAETADAVADGGAGTECALCHLGCGSAVVTHVALPVVDVPATEPPHAPEAYDPSHVDRVDHVPLFVARSC